MNWLRTGRSTGRIAAGRAPAGRSRPVDRHGLRSARQRALHFEFLEARTVMTALPFGALPDHDGGTDATSSEAGEAGAAEAGASDAAE